MKKRDKITLILLAAALLGCGGCSQKAKSAPLMDFQEKVEWKAPTPAAGEKPKILFVGNSHTYYNKLSEMFVNIAKASGHKSSVQELSSGYYTLKQFADTDDQGGALLDKTLSGQSWDFVILQEHIANSLSGDDMFPPSRVLDEKIKKSGGQTAFFMVWTPKKGLKNRKPKQTQSEIASNNMAIADELDSLVIPAGISFMRCLELYPDIELWDQDGQHPSPEGSYLAACTVYAVIFQESPENCSYTGDLDKDLALKLQTVAAETVLN